MEGDAGAKSRLNPTDADSPTEEFDEVAAAEATASTIDAATEDISEAAPQPAPETPGAPSRVGRGWLIAVCVVLVLLSAGVATAGYFALRAHLDSADTARAETAAIKAAQDCVAATQAPDTAAMNLAQQKIIECSTGDFAVQANMYSSMLVDAYKVANVQVKVSDMRTAVERHNDDGSIQVLVAVRIKVTNSQAQDQEASYRLRVQMAQDAGAYKIAKLLQVSN
jgi:Mce-associated membrane protein